jgi:hypothetical protein
MQLKHKGKCVSVTLTKPEERVLKKASVIVGMIMLLPCEAAELASLASNNIDGIIQMTCKAEPEEPVSK